MDYFLKPNPVGCRFWKKVKKGEDCCCGCEGSCSVGVQRNPTIEFCNIKCKANTTRVNHMYVLGADYSKKPRIWNKIRKYLIAEYSLLVNGAVSTKIFTERMNTCKSCDGLIKSADPVGHCGKCGCGSSKRAGLTVKGKMPLATCPLEKWKK